MLKKIANVVALILAIASVLFAAFALFTVFTTDDGKAPQIFGYSILRVISESMEPELPVDSVIFIKETDVKTLKEGDVISFYSNDPDIFGQINTHKIYKVTTDEIGNLCFVTKGVNNPAPDHYNVYPEKIVGKLLFKSSVLGWIVKLLSTTYGYLIIILIPLLIIIIVNVRSIIKMVKSEALKEYEKDEREKIEREIEEKLRSEKNDKDNN